MNASTTDSLISPAKSSNTSKVDESIVSKSGIPEPSLKSTSLRMSSGAYSGFNDAINLHFHDQSINIDPYAYKTSSCIYAFDLTPDTAASQAHISIPKSGTLRLELNYAEALKKGIVVVIYGEFENFINIDGDRQIFTDYAC